MRPAVEPGRSLFWLGMVTVRFNVAQLLNSEPGASREYDLNEGIAYADSNLDVTDLLTGKVHFLRTDNGILVTGHL